MINASLGETKKDTEMSKLEKVLPPIILLVKILFMEAVENKSNREIFEEIYRNKIWESPNSRRVFSAVDHMEQT